MHSMPSAFRFAKKIGKENQLPASTYLKESCFCGLVLQNQLQHHSLLQEPAAFFWPMARLSMLPSISWILRRFSRELSSWKLMGTTVAPSLQLLPSRFLRLFSQQPPGGAFPSCCSGLPKIGKPHPFLPSPRGRLTKAPGSSFYM